MVVVFLACVTSGGIFLELGIGMATAVLVDATVVRMVLVPALMQLFGRANWWIPPMARSRGAAAGPRGELIEGAGSGG
jgi:RND superfamily putative drug exporter